MPKSKSPTDFDVTSDFVVARDSREQAPWSFHFIVLRGKKILVQTDYVALKTGDYSIFGYLDKITIERKSMSDAFSTFGGQRERFERELERMTMFDFACVIIEADRTAVREHPPEFSKVSPEAVIKSADAWMMKYKIPFIFEASRLNAEATCYWFLDRWWKQQKEKEKEDGEA